MPFPQTVFEDTNSLFFYALLKYLQTYGKPEYCVQNEYPILTLKLLYFNKSEHIFFFV